MTEQQNITEDKSVFGTGTQEVVPHVAEDFVPDVKLIDGVPYVSLATLDAAGADLLASIKDVQEGRGPVEYEGPVFTEQNYQDANALLGLFVGGVVDAAEGQLMQEMLREIFGGDLGDGPPDLSGLFDGLPSDDDFI